MPIKAKSARAKGRKLEQWVEKYFADHGLRSRRQPGSGAFAAFPHDNSIEWPDGECVAECKQRKGQPWATGARWLGQADLLVVRADRDEALFVMPARTMDRVVRMMVELEEARADLERREAAARAG